MKFARWIPVAVVVGLMAAFAIGLLMPKDDAVRSAWVGKPMPSMALPAATPGVEGITDALMRDGKPRLVNIFASWCIPCRAEARQLEALAAGGAIIEGVALRDKPEDVRAFLDQYGNPYAHIGADTQSELALALGSSGVPETFLIDGKGIVRAQYQGAITAAQVPEILHALRQMP